jgi:hypothetical protein
LGESDLDADLVSEEDPSPLSKHSSSVTSATAKAEQPRDLNLSSFRAYPKIIREIGLPDIDLADQFQYMELADWTDSLDLTIRGSKVREFCLPPTTHLVATIDDLTDTLDFDSDGINDMLEEAEEPLFASSPVAPANTGKWAAMSTYDVYMVDTPRDDDE